MLDLYSRRQNHLLAALPQSEYQRLSAHLDLVYLYQGRVLAEYGVALKYVYFPTTSIICLMHAMKDGTYAKTASIGNEGMLGVSLLVGDEKTPNRTVVQSSGYACRLSKRVLKEEFNRSSALREIVLHYTKDLITHMAKTAACNRNPVDQQLCRYLDYLRGNLSGLWAHDSITN